MRRTTPTALLISLLVACPAEQPPSSSPDDAAQTMSADTLPESPDDGPDSEADVEPAPDLEAPPDPSPGDPMVRTASRALGGTLRVAGALATSGDSVLVCDGSSVARLSADLADLWTAALESECRAVAVAADRVIAATTGGTWSTLDLATGTPGATVSGPAPAAIVSTPDRAVAAAGPAGIAIAPADLSSPPTLHAPEIDAHALALVGDRLAVADGGLGIALLGFTPDDSLELLSSWEAGAHEQVTAVAAASDARLVATTLGGGMVVLDAASDTLTAVGTLTLDPRGLPLDVAVSPSGDLAVLADWDRARLVDLSDPSTPTVLADEVFPLEDSVAGRALGVAPAADDFVILGIDHVTRLEPHPEVLAPQLWLRPRRLFLPTTEAGGSAVIILTNTGRADLQVTSITADTPRIAFLSPEGGTALIEPGGMEILEFTISGPEPTETTLTVISDDPDTPELQVPVSVAPTLLAPGDPAPDFLVPNLDGELVRLSDLEGKVVYLRMFNAQCQSCVKELPIIEKDFWQVYGDQGLATVAVHLGDKLETAVSFQRQTGITFPMFLDLDAEVLRRYTRAGQSQYLFPLVYLIDTGGKVAHIWQDVEVDHEDLRVAIEALLP